MKIKMDQKEEITFQMAPMIDMVFLLLVFFMCASHLAQQQNVELNIPVAAKAVIPKDRPDRWTVNILKDGQLFEGTNPVSMEELKLHVQSKVAEYKSTGKDLKIYLRADKDAPHKEVKRVMTAMAESGIDDFIFGVYIPPESQNSQ